MWNRKDGTRPAPTLSQAVLRSVIGVAVAVPAVAFVMRLAPRAERTITLRELPANVFQGDAARREPAAAAPLAIISPLRSTGEDSPDRAATPRARLGSSRRRR